ncbi:hypothetical protein AVEN_229538-1 [Araneus ventricosus]|uniref:RNase H type-1 domain-containing protein n=1 Tax=Araneus ventricosus TaxID=182803 RepID=A0A4Y2EJB5_ARAVE|nr:hypothetical protein AVEN_229538-1 [Araneus ventricosus]
MDIFNKLEILCNSCVLHLQWILSHVNLKYNDIADSLPNEVTTMPQAYVEPLTHLELYSRRKTFVNIFRKHPPAHSWYRSEGPVLPYILREIGKAKQLWFAYLPVT